MILGASQLYRTAAVVSYTPRGLGTRADGGAVALMVDLLSCYVTVPAEAPLSSYHCSGSEVKVAKYGQALRAFRELVEKAGRNPEELALHSLRIGGAFTLAAGGEVSERAIQRQERWKSDAYKTYAVQNMEDSIHVCTGTFGGASINLIPCFAFIAVHCCAPLSSRRREILRRLLNEWRCIARQ